MKLVCSGSKNAPAYYIQKSVRINGKSTTKTIERLGSLEKIKVRSGKTEPLVWAKEYAKKLTIAEKEANQNIIVKYASGQIIDKNLRRSCNVGYLFLKNIYHSLGLEKSQELSYPTLKKRLFRLPWIYSNSLNANFIKFIAH